MSNFWLGHPKISQDKSRCNESPVCGWLIVCWLGKAPPLPVDGDLFDRWWKAPPQIAHQPKRRKFMRMKFASHPTQHWAFNYMCWVGLWFFKDHGSDSLNNLESKNHQFKLFQKPSRISSFHQRTVSSGSMKNNSKKKNLNSLMKELTKN